MQLSLSGSFLCGYARTVPVDLRLAGYTIIFFILLYLPPFHMHRVKPLMRLGNHSCLRALGGGRGQVQASLVSHDADLATMYKLMGPAHGAEPCAQLAQTRRTPIDIPARSRVNLTDLG
jgi:hypothetical protein